MPKHSISGFWHPNILFLMSSGMKQVTNTLYTSIGWNPSGLCIGKSMQDELADGIDGWIIERQCCR